MVLVLCLAPGPTTFLACEVKKITQQYLPLFICPLDEYMTMHLPHKVVEKDKGNHRLVKQALEMGCLNTHLEVSICSYQFMQNCEFCAFSYTENSLNSQINPWSPATAPTNINYFRQCQMLSLFIITFIPERAVSAKGIQALELYTTGYECGQVRCTQQKWFSHSEVLFLHSQNEMLR